MLDMKFIRENPDAVLQNVANKNEKVNVQELLDLDAQRRTLVQETDALKNQRNVTSEEIAKLKKNKEDATAKIEEMRTVGDSIKANDDKLREIEEQMQFIVLRIPNMMHSSVPVGASADDNVEVRSTAQRIPQEFRKNHLEIAKQLGILDFERGAKVSGSGFGFYTGKGATLERAMINMFLDLHIAQHGYTEMMPPFVVNRASMLGTGQIPKMEDDMYHCTVDDLFLIPTAEVPLTNYYRDDVLNEKDLPTKFAGYSACFRREGGSYGKDTRGFLRVHEFNKVELVKFVKPETSYNELELLVGDVEDILRALELPFRVLQLCTGDTGFSSAKTYDLEVWSPAEQKFLEVSSCSNFESFQARRANIRFRNEQGKLEFVHTLNGSGLATSRIMVALLEHHQTEDGRIRIPEALRPYTRFDWIG
ncbi:MAG: serine--tRNA ligase [Candidatus Kapabacteria bacterium]|nr:serine--tRNA ligase [Candidatus Kapabacteria bacterium]